jgi:hypothetical protein
MKPKLGLDVVVKSAIPGPARFRTSSARCPAHSQSLHWVIGSIRVPTGAGNFSLHHRVPSSRMRGAIPALPQYAFMAWCLAKKYRDAFTLPLFQLLWAEYKNSDSQLRNAASKYCYSMLVLFLNRTWLPGWFYSCITVWVWTWRHRQVAWAVTIINSAVMKVCNLAEQNLPYFVFSESCNPVKSACT